MSCVKPKVITYFNIYVMYLITYVMYVIYLMLLWDTHTHTAHCAVILGFMMISSPAGKTKGARSFCNLNSLKPISLPLILHHRVWRGKGWLKIYINIFTNDL